MKDSLSFLYQFICYPSRTGSIRPSGDRLCRKMVELANVTNANTILEFGCGSGVITQEIINYKSKNANFIGFEINKHFYKNIKKKFPDVEITNESAQRAKEVLHQKKLKHCDCIISSLPWSIIAQEKRKEIIRVSEEILIDGGSFVTFFYLQALTLQSTKEFIKYLNEEFKEVHKNSVVWKNLPPAVIFTAIK